MMGRLSELSFPGLGIGEFTVDGVAVSFNLFGKPITIMWYGIIIFCAIIAGFSYFAYRAKKAGICFDDVLDITLVTVVIAVMGARLYFVVFYGNYLVTDGTFWENVGGTLYNIIAVWNGGLAIYGGILFGALAVFMMSKIKRIRFFRLGDMILPGVMIAQAMGRWGNFMNGEAYGGPCTMPWRMGICNQSTGYTTQYVHPTFFYESLWNVIGFTLINIFYKKRKFDGEVCMWYFIWYGLGRGFIELLRTDSLWWGPFRVSSLLSFIFVILLLPLLIFLHVRVHKYAVAGKLPVDGLPSIWYLLTGKEDKPMKPRKNKKNGKNTEVADNKTAEPIAEPVEKTETVEPETVESEETDETAEMTADEEKTADVPEETGASEEEKG